MVFGLSIETLKRMQRDDVFGECKEELEGIISPARHCQIAELAAMFAFGGEIKYGAEKRLSLHFLAENESVARKYFTLLEKTFRISKVFSIWGCLYTGKIISM